MYFNLISQKHKQFKDKKSKYKKKEKRKKMGQAYSFCFYSHVSCSQNQLNLLKPQKTAKILYIKIVFHITMTQKISIQE